MEKTNIKITALQFGAEIGDKHKNYSKLENQLSKISETDIIVLPEVWNVGWACDKFIEAAEPIKDSPTINFLSKLAKTKNANIIGGSIIVEKNGKYYNTCPIINRKGELIATYDKMHLYSYYGCNEGNYLTEGQTPILIEIEGIKIGLTICYDIRFPEIYRAYRKAGADIFVNTAAWSNSKPIPWEMMTKSRAIENQTYMVAVNQYGAIENKDYNLGHSRIIDYNGNVISEVLDGENIITATINLSEMYKFREKCTILSDIKKSYEVKSI